MTDRTGIVILSHFDDRSLMRHCADTLHDCGAAYDVFLLSDRTQPSLTLARRPRGLREIRFVIDDLIGLGYPRRQELAIGRAGRRNLKLGNADLPLLLLYLSHPGYRYYWLVEYDVRFTGSWREFFAAFDDNDADLLGTSLRRFEDSPGWDHWGGLHVPILAPDSHERLRGFFPIYRVSNRALAVLHDAGLRGCSGHMEGVMPTLLYNLGLRIEDIGGDGEFVRPGNTNRYYRNTLTGDSLSPGTFVYRPVIAKAGDEPNKLWHPVKAARSPIVRWSRGAYTAAAGALLAYKRGLWQRGSTRRPARPRDQ
jgi:hypothetical protein